MRCWDVRGLSLASRVLQANQRCPPSDWLADAETTKGAHTRWMSAPRRRTLTTTCLESALATTAYKALVYSLPQAVKGVQLKLSSLTFDWESLSRRPHHFRQLVTRLRTSIFFLPNLRQSRALIMNNFPPKVQHILAPAFGILSATHITQMADRLMEMHGFSMPLLSALSTPSNPPASPISTFEIGLGKLADDIASPQKRTVSPSFRSQPKLSTTHVQSSHSARSNPAVICWYHTTFGVKVRRCMSPCCFTSKQSKRVKPVSPKVSAANLPDSSNPGRIFYVRDTRSGRRFSVDNGAQLSVTLPTPADRRCPNPGLFLQAVNTSTMVTCGTCSLSLDIGLRRLFP
nr:unnamed protein product [Spirometra erinaceieuropaei]